MQYCSCLAKVCESSLGRDSDIGILPSPRQRGSPGSVWDMLEEARRRVPAGPRGEVGAIGPRGNSGPRGQRGEIGERGGPGEGGELGEPGPAGPAGPAGAIGSIGPAVIPLDGESPSK